MARLVEQEPGLETTINSHKNSIYPFFDQIIENGTTDRCPSGKGKMSQTFRWDGIDNLVIPDNLQGLTGFFQIAARLHYVE
jgi:hypothetical protein